MALVEIETRASWPMPQGEVLQVALAAFVADRAIQWMVDQQELERPSTCFEDFFCLGVDDHAFAHGRGAGRLRGLGHLLDVNEAHTTRAQWRHLGVVAVNRDLDTGLLRCCPDQCSGRHCDRDAVYCQVYKLVLFLFWHMVLLFVSLSFPWHPHGLPGLVHPAPTMQCPSRMWYAYSSRNSLILLVTGLVAASPRGQNDLPPMLSQMSISRSMSLSLP